MFDRPRNWKWMVPAALIAPCLFWWNDWMSGGGVWVDLAVIPLVLLIILFIATVVNLVIYIYDHWTDLYATVQNARNSTAEVRMFEAARGMHPDAVQALLIHRRAIWRIKYVPLKDIADWILDEAPTVHAGFVDFVLDHSNSVSVMSQHGILSQGSKQFDPDGLIEDRQQYDDLIRLWQAKLICTQAVGNQPPKWLPPWTPDLVRHRFGLDGDQYVVEEQSEAIQAIRRAQAVQKPAARQDVIEKALEGLEQTQEMRARTRTI